MLQFPHNVQEKRDFLPFCFLTLYNHADFSNHEGQIDLFDAVTDVERSIDWCIRSREGCKSGPNTTPQNYEC